MTTIKLFLITSIFISTFAFGQSDKIQELKSELIGTREVVEIIDHKGVKIDTLWHDVPGLKMRGHEIPEEPLIILTELIQSNSPLKI